MLAHLLIFHLQVLVSHMGTSLSRAHSIPIQLLSCSLGKLWKDDPKPSQMGHPKEASNSWLWIIQFRLNDQLESKDLSLSLFYLNLLLQLK